MKQQEYILTEDTHSELKRILLKGNYKNALIVHGKKSYISCGAKDSVEKAVSSLDLKLYEVSNFTENPKDEELQKILKDLKDRSLDIIIGIGGGTVMDMSKLIAHNLNSEKENQITLIAIPTTAGTGAEATRFAVLYKNGIKTSVEADSILPDIAILDYKFTLNNPPLLTARTGFDALAQAIESYWSKRASEKSDSYAMSAINLIFENLPKAVNKNDKNAKRKMMEGAYKAGCAINLTTTTAPHAFSYPFTSHYNIPHGEAVALTFPAVAEKNLSNWDNNAKKKYLLTVFKSDIGRIKNTLLEYIKSIHLRTLIDIKYDPQLILKNINPQRLSNNPVNFSFEDIQLILEPLYNNHES